MCGGRGGTSGSVIASITAGPPGGQGVVPGLADRVGRGDPDPLEPDQLGVAGVGEVGQGLGDREPGVTGHHALLPRDLVEIVVVEDEHDQLRLGQRSW